MDLTQRYRSSGEQSLLDTGPVVLSFTPINQPRSSDIHGSPDGLCSDLDFTGSGFTALNQKTQPGGASAKPRDSTKTTKKRTRSERGEDPSQKPSKQARVQPNATSQPKLPCKKPSASKTSVKAPPGPRFAAPCGEFGEDPALWKLPAGYDGRGDVAPGRASPSGSELRNRDLEDFDQADDGLECICDEDLLDLVNTFDEDICDEDFANPVNGVDENISDKDCLGPSSALEGDICDEDFLELAHTLDDSRARQDEYVPVHPKLNWGTSKRYQQPEAHPLSGFVEVPEKGTATEDGISSFDELSSFSSQAFPASTLSSSKPTCDLSSTSPALSEAPRHLKPFINPAVPSAVGERSPIAGVSSHPRVVTHFRLGQALNDAAMRNKELRASDAIVELYARVLKSRREGSRQSFELADLFHYTRAPYLSADWVGWKGLPYFELDGAAFLEEGASEKICRAIGRIEKNSGNGWRMCVLSIWEASWDDIDAVKGVVCI